MNENQEPNTGLNKASCKTGSGKREAEEDPELAISHSPTNSTATYGLLPCKTDLKT